MPLKDASFKESPKIKLHPPQNLFWITSFGTGVLYFVSLSHDILNLKDPSPTTALLHISMAVLTFRLLQSSPTQEFMELLHFPRLSPGSNPVISPLPKTAASLTD